MREASAPASIGLRARLAQGLRVGLLALAVSFAVPPPARACPLELLLYVPLERLMLLRVALAPPGPCAPGAGCRQAPARGGDAG